MLQARIFCYLYKPEYVWLGVGASSPISFLSQISPPGSARGLALVWWLSPPCYPPEL